MKWLFFISLLLAAQGSAQVGLKRRAADELLKKGDAYHAMGIYRDLIRDTPNDPELHYNLGNALYRMQLWDDAIKVYQKAQSLASDDALKQRIQYNIANCLYKKQQLQESIEGYKQTLRKDPSDQDARINLELALNQMQKESQQKNDSNPDSKNQQNDNKDKPQEKNQKDNSQKQQQPQKPKEEQDKQMAQNPKMSRKDAERILDALKDKEKELQKKRVLENLRTQERTTKDW